ncbi:MAG: hypothetical protein QM658_14130 [Gordonia sp. (in: high G+C Gram-positive bacteria)]
MTAYHPWRDAAGRGALDIVFVDHLPAGVRGRTCGNLIEINADALQRERRCALAHELVHHERGIVPSDPVLLAREESVVERAAARRLIALDRLLDVLLWTSHAEEIADELWVDVPMLRALVADLTPAEHRWINTELSRRAA